MDARQARDRRAGILYCLEHDLPKIREALERAFEGAIDQRQSQSVHFIDGRRYPIGRAMKAFDESVAAVREELSRSSSEGETQPLSG